MLRKKLKSIKKNLKDSWASAGEHVAQADKFRKKQDAYLAKRDRMYKKKIKKVKV